jgi:hypothetical protein
MATKTVSVHLEAYERLRAARRFPGESFSDVILRAQWPGKVLLGRNLLAAVRERGPLLDAETLERLERLQREDQPPVDKWQTASSSKRPS